MSDQDKEKQTDGNATANGDQDKGQAQPNPDTPPDKGEQTKTVPYARFQQVNEQKKAAEETLKNVVTELLEDIPEDFRELVPKGLAPADQIAWIRAATKKGIFSQGQGNASGPDSKRPGGKPGLDLDNMSPAQMREAGYK